MLFIATLSRAECAGSHEFSYRPNNMGIFTGRRNEDRIESLT